MLKVARDGTVRWRLVGFIKSAALRVQLVLYVRGLNPCYTGAPLNDTDAPFGSFQDLVLVYPIGFNQLFNYMW